MKLKNDVKITNKNGYSLLSNGKKVCIDSPEVYIFKAILDGIVDDEKIKLIIMKHENCNDIIGDLLLAKFIVKYGEFLVDDNDNYTITY